MKKILTTLFVALTLVVTISSCNKEEESCKMCGDYDGTVSGPLKITLIPIDTILENVAASSSLAETTFSDSVSLTVNVTVDGTPVSVTVLAHKDTETTFSVVNTIYNYAGSIPLLINGTGTADGTNATAAVTIAAGDGSTTDISGNLNFTSN